MDQPDDPELFRSDYPIDKLEMIIVDDFSTDRSVEVIKNTVRNSAWKRAVPHAGTHPRFPPKNE
jgi:glycosyltransferase involved in cell wall biosynthesis